MLTRNDERITLFEMEECIFDDSGLNSSNCMFSLIKHSVSSYSSFLEVLLVAGNHLSQVISIV